MRIERWGPGRRLSALAWNTYSGVRGFLPTFEDLDRFHGLDPDQARERLARRLLEQIRCFGTRPDALPEWREAARWTDWRELWRAWPSLPILTKRDLQQRFDPLETQRRHGIQGLVLSTGGSTGEPTRFLHDRAMLKATAAARVYSRLKLGWRPGLDTICIWGSERDIGKQASLRSRISARLRADWIVGGYELTEATVDRVLALIRARSPVAVYGFTTMLDHVARRTLERGDAVPEGSVRTAWNGGEMLFDDQVARFRSAFGVPILNFYGGREFGPIAYQESPQDALRILRPLLFIELVDDRNRPAPPGELARVLVTSMVCRGTPFLRYEVGDIAEYASDDDDGSGLCRLRRLHGRVSSLLRLPDGRAISCLYWNHLLKDYPEVARFQVALLGGRQLEIRLQATIGESSLRRLEGTLQHFLGDVPFRIALVSEIPATREGKRLQVVRE